MYNRITTFLNALCHLIEDMYPLRQKLWRVCHVNIVIIVGLLVHFVQYEISYFLNVEEIAVVDLFEGKGGDARQM